MSEKFGGAENLIKKVEDSKKKMTSKDSTDADKLAAHFELMQHGREADEYLREEAEAENAEFDKQKLQTEKHLDENQNEQEPGSSKIPETKTAPQLQIEKLKAEFKEIESQITETIKSKLPELELKLEQIKDIEEKSDLLANVKNAKNGHLCFTTQFVNFVGRPDLADALFQKEMELLTTFYANPELGEDSKPHPLNFDDYMISDFVNSYIKNTNDEQIVPRADQIIRSFDAFDWKKPYKHRLNEYQVQWYIMRDIICEALSHPISDNTKMDLFEKTFNTRAMQKGLEKRDYLSNIDDPSYLNFQVLSSLIAGVEDGEEKSKAEKKLAAIVAANDLFISTEGIGMFMRSKAFTNKEKKQMFDHQVDLAKEGKNTQEHLRVLEEVYKRKVPGDSDVESV